MPRAASSAGWPRIEATTDWIHPGQIREFYDALTTLALRQPGDEAHIKTVATILNEKQQIETIMPALKH